MVANSLRLTYDYLNENLTHEFRSTTSESFSKGKLTECCIYFANRIGQVCVNCAAAACTTSIQSFERKF